MPFQGSCKTVCFVTEGAVKQVASATMNPANSTRSPSQILQSTFLLALLMQIYVNAQDLKALESTSQSNRLIRQEISCSVLEDTVKSNNTNLLTSLFLKRKIN